MYCTIPYYSICTILYVLYYTMLYYIILYVLHDTICTILHSTILYYITLHYCILCVLNQTRGISTMHSLVPVLYYTILNGGSTRGPTGATAPVDMSLAPPVAPPRDDQIK